MIKSIERPEHDHLVRLLIAARERAGLSQGKLAKKLGRAQPYVSKYEAGVQRLDLCEILDIARATGADAADIVREVDRATRKSGKPAAVFI